MQEEGEVNLAFADGRAGSERGALRLLKSWVLKTSRKAAWAPILVFVIHVILLRVFHIYDTYPALDIPMHFAGGVAIAYFFFHTTAIAVGLGALGAPNRLMVLVLTFTLGCSSTVFWEFAEFLFDRHWGTRAQLGLQDTLGDMLMGIVGAAVFVCIQRLRKGGANQRS